MYKIKIQKKGVQFQVAMLMCFVIKLSPPFSCPFLLLFLLLHHHHLYPSENDMICSSLGLIN